MNLTQIMKNKIPNIIHFVFGMKQDFGGKPFNLIHYLAIKSAFDVNSPDIIYFHYQYEPSGVWWEKAKHFIKLNKIEAPTEIFNNPLCHVAHQADVVRLQMLQKYGGIYLDLDTICVKPFTPLLSYDFVIGTEANEAFLELPFLEKIIRRFINIIFLKKKKNNKIGLCNAVILSKPNSNFVNLWISEYKSFRSKGRDAYWAEHSVLLPLKLVEKYKKDVKVLKYDAFHYPTWTSNGLKKMHEENNEYKNAYCHHLWESQSWEPYLSTLTEEEIKKEKTTYTTIASKFL